MVSFDLSLTEVKSAQGAHSYHPDMLHRRASPPMGPPLRPVIQPLLRRDVRQTVARQALQPQARQTG